MRTRRGASIAAVTVLPVTGLPEVTPGDDLAAMISRAIAIEAGDIVVVTSKIVSKAAGLYVEGERAEAVRAESTRVVAERATATGVTRIVEALAGPVMAGAGIDASNAGDDRLLLLPREPDRSAADLRAALVAAGAPEHIGVILSDTSGRPWRAGLSDFALGIAGVHALDDLRGRPDTDGRDLAVTVRNLADEIAAAADLVKGKIDHIPAAIVRGLGRLVGESEYGARDMTRTGASDWFGLGQHEAVRAALGIEPGSVQAEDIGIPSVNSEALPERLARAIRTARCVHPCQPEVTIAATANHSRLVITGHDQRALGYLWARVEVALRGEGISVVSCESAPTSVTLQLRG